MESNQALQHGSCLMADINVFATEPKQHTCTQRSCTSVSAHAQLTHKFLPERLQALPIAWWSTTLRLGIWLGAGSSACTTHGCPS